MCYTVSMPPELLLVELVQQCGQDLKTFLHDRERTVLIVSMVDTAVAIATYLEREGGREGGRGRRGGGKGEGGRKREGRGGRRGGGGRGGGGESARRKEEGGSQKFFVLTHLYVKPCLLEVSDQWEAAGDGVWLALTHHLLRSLLKLLEGI